MKTAALLNTRSGLIRDQTSETVGSLLKTAFENAGREILVVPTAPGDLEQILEKDCNDADVIIAGGGDGTVGCCANFCIRNEKILGVLPGGTMNLFARSLGMPLQPEKAATALANGREGRADYGTANGQVFLHQYSVGMQPKLVRRRAQRSYQSRLGKVMAGITATAETILAPPKFDCALTLEGQEQKLELSMIAVSNNPHSEGHLPYPESLNTNRLGIYHAPPLGAGASAKLVSDLLLGRWSVNPDLTIAQAREVTLRFSNLNDARKALLDGEVIELEDEVQLISHGGGLRVLKPGTSGTGGN